MVSGDPSRAQATVDLSAIADNYSRVSECGAAVMAVVKADAYGHGVERIAPLMRDLGAPWLGVALPSEALALRAAGDRGRLLAWLWSPGDPTIVDCVASEVDLSVSDSWALHEVVEAARSTHRRAKVHLKVDSGLSRNGAPLPTWPQLASEAKKASDAGTVEVVGVWSHLGSADVPNDPRTNEQRDAFISALEIASSVGIEPELRHLANSAAALTRPDLAFDIVRSGIALYGLSPGLDMGTAAELRLRPAMTLRARLAHVKALPAGSQVSYGAAFRSTHDTMVGLVPMGYGDGVPRAASNVVDVYVGGRRCPVIGRVAMDQFVVDLGPQATERAGEDVICFGPGLDGEPTADEWATRMDTIGYEIVTRLGARVPRRYEPLSA